MQKLIIFLALLLCLVINTSVTPQVATVNAQPSGSKTIEPLIGLWSSVTRFNDNSPREIMVSRERSTWRVRTRGRDAAYEGQAPVRITVPGQGTFRGSFDTRTNVIHGFWLEPLGRLSGLQ